MDDEDNTTQDVTMTGGDATTGQQPTTAAEPSTGDATTAGDESASDGTTRGARSTGDEESTTGDDPAESEDSTGGAGETTSADETTGEGTSTGEVGDLACQLDAIAIPGDGAAAEVVLSFEDTDQTAEDIGAVVGISHGAIGELAIELEHAGTTVVLFDQACGDADNLDVFFSDLGTALDCSDPDGETGLTMPASPLSAFDGQDLSGPWTLRVVDNVDNDTSGTIAIACVTP